MDYNNYDDNSNQSQNENNDNGWNQYNNGQQRDSNEPNERYTATAPNGLATASLVLGILAIVSVCCVYGSWIFGGIGITLGLLSRGKEKHMCKNALTGVITSIVGIVLSVVILVASVVSLITTLGDGGLEKFIKEYQEVMEEQMGLDEDYWEGLIDDDSIYKGVFFNDDTL